jgi:type IV secretory pathway TrbL component
MVDAAAIEAAILLAEQIVAALIKVAPAIMQGLVSEAPYVQAIAGMITGGNATQAQVDALLAQIKADSADFQTPLPVDDGTTTS